MARRTTPTRSNLLDIARSLAGVFSRVFKKNLDSKTLGILFDQDMIGGNRCFINLTTLSAELHIDSGDITSYLTQAGFSLEMDDFPFYFSTHFPYEDRIDWSPFSHKSRDFILSSSTRFLHIFRELFLKRYTKDPAQMSRFFSEDETDQMLMYTSIIRLSGVIGFNTINEESRPAHVLSVIIHNATVFENLQIETVYGSVKAHHWSQMLTDKWIVGNPFCCQLASGRLHDNDDDDKEWKEAMNAFTRLLIPIIDCGSFALMLRNALFLAAKFPFKAATHGLIWGSPPIIVLAFSRLTSFLMLNCEQLEFYLMACGFVEVREIDIGSVEHSIINFFSRLVQENVYLYFHESLVLTPSTVMDDNEDPKYVISRLSEQPLKQFITHDNIAIFRAGLDEYAYVIPDKSKLERWHPRNADEKGC